MRRSRYGKVDDMRKARGRTRTVAVGLASLVIALAGSGALPAAEHEEKVSRQFAAREGMIVEIENLAGDVAVEGTAGGEVGIDAVIIARDDSDDEARRLAAKLEIKFEERGNRLLVKAVYPVDEHTKYHYPGSSETGGWWLFGGSSQTKTRYQGRMVSVVSKPRSGAVTLFAHFTVRLPHGVGAEVRNAVGDLEATGVHGPLSFDTGSGNVRAVSGEGPVNADTGSGEVEVRDYRGDVDADTGSGDVRIADVRGGVKADTGSGEVTIEDVDGGVIDANTGSGDVELVRVRGEIHADTGSGEVDGRDLEAMGRLEADTGSGGVSLEGDFSEIEGILIDTGSGGVTIDATGVAPMDVTINTGSGGIRVDLPDMQILKKENDYFKARVGGGGAKVVIDTGSGGVRIRHTG